MAFGRPISLFESRELTLPLSIDRRQGGSGWFGTVGIGYDWQFNGPWVFGLFADGQFGSIKGTLEDPFNQVIAPIKLQDSWAVGARVGYLVAPNVLSYVNGGYSGSHWSGTTLLDEFTGAPVGGHTDGFNRNGWFIGGGVENNLNFFGITSPGWFMKTEYRSAFYDTEVRPSAGRRHQFTCRSRSQVQQLEPDHLDFAGLSLQLGWRGRPQVLIFC